MKMKEWNALLKDGILNHRWLSLHCELDTSLIISDQVVPNPYGLDINDNPVLDSQAIDNPDPLEKYVKYNEDIWKVDPINPAMDEGGCSSNGNPLGEYFDTSDNFLADGYTKKIKDC